MNALYVYSDVEFLYKTLSRMKKIHKVIDNSTCCSKHKVYRVYVETELTENELFEKLNSKNYSNTTITVTTTYLRG